MLSILEPIRQSINTALKKKQEKMNCKHSMDPEPWNQFNQHHADLNEKLKERSNHNPSPGTKVISKVVSNKWSHK